MFVVAGDTSRATRTIIKEKMMAWQATEIKIGMSEWWIAAYNDLSHGTPEHDLPIRPTHIQNIKEYETGQVYGTRFDYYFSCVA